MIISQKQVHSVIRAYLRLRPVAEERPASTVTGSLRGTDKVDLSTEARDISLARQVLAKVPEIREDRVKAIEQAIADGNYDVSDDQIADKMINRLLVEDILKGDK